MKKFKTIISLLLAVCLISGFCSALAATESCAVIGADLTADQVSSVYGKFGVKRGDVKEITLSSSDEYKYLGNTLDSSIIGTRSISCAYIELLSSGKGIETSVHNISYCTAEMYKNALITAGISDAKITVVSPIEGISGTAALAGIFKAYENISGSTLDGTAIDTAVQELTVTSDLANELSGTASSEDVSALVTELKLALDQISGMSDDELRETIKSLAAEHNFSLTDDQIDQLVSLCRQLQGLNIDELKDKITSMSAAADKAQEALGVAGGFISSVKSFFSGIGSFFSDIAASVSSFLSGFGG